jgi:Ca2+-transporting ATPase
MGDSSELAKEVGDLILINNDFAIILKAIEQGRVIYMNIKKSVAYILSNSFVEITLIFGAMLLGLPAPLSVAQILFKHLICDGPSDIVLGFESAEDNLMKKEYLIDHKRKQILDGEVMTIISGVSVIIGLIGLLVFVYFYNKTGDLEFTRTVTFISVAAVDAVYIYSFKSLKFSIFKMQRFFKNKYVFLATIYGVALLLISVYVPVVRDALGNILIAPKYFVIPLAVSLFSIIWVELVKAVVRKNNLA